MLPVKRIVFEPCDTSVRVIVQTGFPLDDGQTFAFTFSVGAKWIAQLLAHSFEMGLAEKLCEIRRHAYDQGWRHAKARNPKRVSHHGGWTD